MDGVIANFHKEPYNRANAMSRDWIANLEPFAANVATVKELVASGKSVYINSLAASEDAKQGKIDWLKRYLPEIPKNHIIIIVGNGRKADYMKTKTGTLVDDRIDNCKQWTRISGQPAVWVATKGGAINV